MLKEAIKSTILWILKQIFSLMNGVHYDKNHDGCAIEFPMKMNSCITWTRSYKQIENIDKKMFFERLYIFVVKKRV